MNVHQIERDGAQEPLHGAADVEGKRRRTTARTARQRNALPDRENPGILALQNRARLGIGLANQPPRLANRRPRIRRSNDQNPMPPSRQLLGSPSNILIDIMPRPP